MKQLILFLFSPLLLSAQVQHNDNLFLDLQKMDSLLFQRGFNHCDIEVLHRIVSDDLEFYHDQSGVSSTKAEFLNSVEQNICSSPLQKPIRKLRPGTLEVFPLYENGVLYGAIQTGEHDFFIREPDKELYGTSTARFTHVWLKKNENWKLKRVLSYDHKAIPKR